MPRTPEPRQLFSPKPLILPGLSQRKPQERLRPTASPHSFASPPTAVLPYAGSAVLPVSTGLLALTSRQSFPRWRGPLYLVKTNPQYPKNRKRKKKKNDGRVRGKISPRTWPEIENCKLSSSRDWPFLTQFSVILWPRNRLSGSIKLLLCRCGCLSPKPSPSGLSGFLPNLSTEGTLPPGSSLTSAQAWLAHPCHPPLTGSWGWDAVPVPSGSPAPSKHGQSRAHRTGPADELETVAALGGMQSCPGSEHPRNQEPCKPSAQQQAASTGGREATLTLSWECVSLLVQTSKVLFDGLIFFFLLGIFLFVVNSIIHWNEKALGSHVFPIPIPSPTSLPTRSLQVLPEHQVRALVSCIQPGPVICFTLDSIHVSMLMDWFLKCTQLDSPAGFKHVLITYNSSSFPPWTCVKLLR